MIEFRETGEMLTTHVPYNERNINIEQVPAREQEMRVNSCIASDFHGVGGAPGGREFAVSRPPIHGIHSPGLQDSVRFVVQDN